jgi:hypothetical protein
MLWIVLTFSFIFRMSKQSGDVQCSFLQSSGLFLAMSRDGLQARGDAAKAALGSQLQYSPAILVIHCSQPARTRPPAFWAQASQFAVQIEVVLIFLGPIHDLRMAEYAVVDIVVARAEAGDFGDDLVNGPMSNSGSENVGHGAEPAVVRAATRGEDGVHHIASPRQQVPSHRRGLFQRGPLLDVMDRAP